MEYTLTHNIDSRAIVMYIEVQYEVAVQVCVAPALYESVYPSPIGQLAI